jgi:hypothetical protein
MDRLNAAISVCLGMGPQLEVIVAPYRVWNFSIIGKNRVFQHNRPQAAAHGAGQPNKKTHSGVQADAVITPDFGRLSHDRTSPSAKI